MGCSAARFPWRERPRNLRRRRRTPSMYSATAYSSLAVILATAAGGNRLSALAPAASAHASPSASASASASASPSSVLRRRERRRRLGGHRYLHGRGGGEEGAGGPIFGRRSSGSVPVDYGGTHPYERMEDIRRRHRRRERETGLVRSEEEVSGGGGDGAGGVDPRAGGRMSATTEMPPVVETEEETAVEKEGGEILRAAASDPAASSGRRRLQTDQFSDPAGTGGTFGPWWYEPDWEFDSWSASLGMPSSWSYPLPEDYPYNPTGGTEDFPEWFDWTEYRPIRISAQYDLPEGEDLKNEFLKNVVLPGAIQFWTKALMVYPARRLFVNPEGCQMASENDWKNGLLGVDLMLYVRAEKECGDGTLAAAASCDWDQFDKPIGGVIEFCFDTMKLNADGTASPRNLRVAIETAIHELAHVLGFASEDMAFYFDRTTGQGRSPRPIDTTKNFLCITPNETDEVFVPNNNTLREGKTSEGVRYFELVTPTVAQAARNHFNCDKVQGIRLENQPTAGDCFGDHLEERLLWNDIMSAVATTTSVPEFLSPILLALFEDTGWYRANYTMSRVVPFGHGAGCAFVDEPCIDADGNVPEHNKEFFCNSQDKATDFHCDPSHTIVATCDVVDFSVVAGGSVSVPSEMQYFDNPNLGGKTIRTDFCPIYSDFIFTCREPVPSSLGRLEIFPEESYAASSRCFNSDYARPLCLETICNAEVGRAQVVVNGETLTCETDGQLLPIVSQEIKVECPPLAVICPELVCPANCAGRGKCLWEEDTPSCDCFDESGGGESCTAYRIGSPDVEGDGGGEMDGEEIDWEFTADDGETGGGETEGTVGDGGVADGETDEEIAKDDGTGTGGVDEGNENGLGNVGVDSDTGGGGPDVEDFYGCRDWCEDLPLPWKSDDPAETHKCGWTFACSMCEPCLAEQ